MNIRDVSIIVVEDDEGMVGFLERAFAGAKSFAYFRDARDFLASAALGRCDIVFMDINIPGGQNGIELTGHVKRVAPQCDVVVMTGDATLDNALAAMKAGAYDFLRKPFSYEYLESAVDRCVEKRGISSELRMLKAAQEELSAAYSQLQSSERVKEAFISVVGHELRTPLAKILTGAELLRFNDLEQRGEVLDGVLAGARELHESIESIILYADSRKELAPKNCRDVDLAEAARAVLAELAKKADEAGVSLSLRLSGEGTVVPGEPAWLRNAIKRLALNAITFNKRGGSAEVCVEGEAGSVSVTVSDSGIGIPKELIAGLGTPFYQIADYLTRTVGGLGLGLAIVKQVVEAHNGQMSAKNLPGGGTAFTVTFKKAVSGARAARPG
jgi:signal transduction histidine kinase